MRLLIEEAAKIGVALAPEQVEKFAAYMRLLLEWNKKFNLTAVTGERDIILKHFIDSLSVVRLIGGVKAAGACGIVNMTPFAKGEHGGANKKNESEAMTVIDVGTGAGFPGVPIKIAKPDIELTLLEATKKKAAFLTELIKELGLEKVSAVCARAEEAGREAGMRESFDVAVSRAVAPLEILAEYCLPFVKTGGRFLALKGPDVEREIKSAGAMIKKLGGETIEIVPVFISGTDDNGEACGLRHCIVVVDKVRGTPAAYPRANGEIVRSKR